MKFVCPELLGDRKTALQLLFDVETGTKRDFLQDTGGNNNPLFFRQIPTDVKNQLNLYAREPMMKKYLASYPYYKESGIRYTGHFRTFTTLAADLGLTLGVALPATDTGLNLITNLSATEYGKKWAVMFHNLADIESSYWYTVLGDNGLYLLKPERLTASKEIAQYVLMSEMQTNATATTFDNLSFTGETSKYFTIDSEFDGVVPSIEDSDTRKIAVNKKLSKNGRITIQSAQDANPLDYVVYAGSIYVVMSKATVKTGYYEYIAVLEKNGAQTFSATPAYPNRPAMNSVDNWHIVGAAGEPAFVNSWVNFDATTYQGLRFIRDDFGIVRYEGLIKNGAADTITTFPAGYRPALNVFHTGSAYNGATINVCSVRVTSAGVLTAERAAGTNWTALSGWFYVGW